MTQPNADSLTACPHGDRTCPCSDGDPCHYETIGGSPGLACPTENPCTVTVPHQRYEARRG